MFGSCKPAFLEDDRIFQFLHHGHSNTDKTAFHKIHFLNTNTNYKFLLPPSEVGESENIKKRGWKYGAGAGLLKRGGELALYLFNFFEVYHFYIEKLLYKVIISRRTQPTSADISSRHQPTSAATIWCVLQLMMTLLYVKMHVRTSACVTKPMSGASCS